jgi:3',5'-cyclic AMP phosphodiesterase CpdA
MRFAVLGDLHFTEYSTPEFSQARDYTFTSFFTQLRWRQPDLVFAIGDTINRGTIAELVEQERVVHRSGVKLIRLLGNHDNDLLEKSELKPWFLGSFNSAGEDGLYTAFDYEHCRFVIMDTARVKMSHIDYGGIVLEPQLKWLEAQVEDFNSAVNLQYLIVLGHHPFANTTHRSEKPMLFISNGDEVLKIFGKLRRGQGLYFCGHNHSHSIYGPVAGNWFIVQAGAPFECEGYRLVTVDKDGLELETVDFDMNEPELRNSFELTRRNIEGGFELHLFEDMYGKPEDRELYIKR